jgi:dethiobiotin synthetase
VVEGAGGLLAPLSWASPADPFYSVLDLAVHCDLDAIIVARAGLGTLNHIAMTVAMLRSRAVTVKGVVLNGARRPATDLAEATNPDVLARMLPGLRIITVPQHGGSDVIDAIVPYVSELIT